MKNLVVATQKTFLHPNKNFSTKENYFCCHNVDKDIFYVIRQSDKKLIIINLNSIDENLDIDIDAHSKDATPIGIVYCSINERVYCAFDSGIMFEINHKPDNKISYEDIAMVPEGAHLLSISPDHELIVILSKKNQIFIMSSEMELLNMVPLESTEFGEKEFITVGWGKKETQFHGSEGKNAAKMKVNVTNKADNDDNLPLISWRGDGSMFVVSFIDKALDVRRLKIFTRLGNLQYTSELVDCLENTLSWKPSGNLIVSSRDLPNKHTLAFFEKNGLLHRESTLSFNTKNVKIRELFWSRDSDILVIWFKSLDSETMHLQLWSEKNYHWYLKQTITYPKENPIIYVTWSLNLNNDLVIISHKTVTAYTFRWEATYSRGKKETDKAVVAVVDGYKINITSFREVVIPPPMAQVVLECEDTVNSLSFAPAKSTINSNDFLVMLQNNKLVHFHQTSDHTNYIKQNAFNLINFENGNTLTNFFTHNMHHIMWFQPSIVLCCITTDSGDLLCSLNLVENNSPNKEITAKIILKCSEPIEHIISSVNPDIAYIFTSKSCYKCIKNISQDLKIEILENDFMRDAFVKKIMKIEEVSVGEKNVYVALSKKNILYVDWKQVSNNITSFYIHSQFLLLTTLQHSLLSFKLNPIDFHKLFTKDLTVKPWEEEEKSQFQELHIRRLERGATIVIAVSNDSRLILQMPRGNLECIQPRALSIDIISSYLNQINYKKAFDLCRKQRINLNLLYDHNPKQFEDNVEKFVGDVENPTWLSLFISELKNENVTTTIYLSSYDCSANSPENNENCEKVETICNLLRNVMNRDADKYIQPILLSLVKNQHQEGLEKALKKIKDLLDNSEKNSSNIPAQEALNYLLYVVSVDVLFNTALGLYDFDLVMFVAAKSQKDPKEYVPFLNNLKALESNYMKYTIDKHLKRYNSALNHLCQIPEKFQECLQFIEDHQLHMSALKMLKSETPEFRSVAKSFATFLSTKSRHHEAGIMFTKSENYEEALNSFMQAVSWQDVLVTVDKLSLSLDKRQEIYNFLVNRLKLENRYEDVASILIHQLNKEEEAVITLCRGQRWHSAWYMAHNLKKEVLLDKIIEPEIIKYANSILNDVKTKTKNFIHYQTRLEIVRAELTKKEEKMKENLNVVDSLESNIDCKDFLSDTTSVTGSSLSRSSHASRLSGRTNKSSKNRRKQERKMQNIKEGSIFEDLAIIHTLHQIYTDAYNQKEEIKNLADILLRINKNEIAEELYKCMKLFLMHLTDKKYTIWSKKSISELLQLQNSESTNTFRQIPNFMDLKILQVPEQKDSEWILDCYKYIFEKK